MIPNDNIVCNKNKYLKTSELKCGQNNLKNGPRYFNVV